MESKFRELLFQSVKRCARNEAQRKDILVCSLACVRPAWPASGFLQGRRSAAYGQGSRQKLPHVQVAAEQ